MVGFDEEVAEEVPSVFGVEGLWFSSKCISVLYQFLGSFHDKHWVGGGLFFFGFGKGVEHRFGV